MKKSVTVMLLCCMLFCGTACDILSSSSGGGGGNYDYNYSGGGTSFNDDMDEDEFFAKQNLKKDNAVYSAVSPVSSARDSFIGYINGINTNYTYASYYKVDEAMRRYNALSSLRNTPHDGILENITEDALYERVKSNNAVYKANVKEYTDVFYEDFSDSDLRRYCSIVVQAVNYYISLGTVDDIHEVKCVLGDLKIFGKSMMTNAYVSDDNCLMISPSMIDSLKVKDLDGKIDVEFSTIAHEAMHMIQKGCAHNNEIVYNIGNAFKFEDMSIHPLFYTWFYEGAAERLVNNYRGHHPLVYEYYIYYINSMTLSRVLNRSNSVYGVEQCTLSSSLDPLFTYFGCSAESEKTEFLNMLFSLEIIETDDPEFKNAVDPNMSEEKLVEIKRDLKNSICETMAKDFYVSLADMFSDGAVPLNDIFYYITVFENDVNSHIVFTDEGKRNSASSFIANYTAIQDEFFRMLSSGGVYTYDTIVSMFNSYGLVNGVGQKNFTLGGLSSDKREFLMEMLIRTYQPAFTNIRSYS